MVLVDHTMSQTLRINFKVDVKGPYIVFPEHGSIQKCVHNAKKLINCQACSSLEITGRDF